MQNSKRGKIQRVLGLYKKLMDGQVIKKEEEAKLYGVDGRSIQRDIDEIRNFLVEDADENGGIRRSVCYSHEEKGYRIEEADDRHLTNPELLALCKILLDSRAFTEKEMSVMLDKLIDCCAPLENRKLVKDLILSEKDCYVQPRHGKRVIDKLWSIGQAIRSQNLIEIEYLRISDHTVKKRRLKPAAIMFSDFYFYLAAFIDDETVRKDFQNENDLYPTIYRIDRIQKLKVLEEKFEIIYKERFKEGEFRKRIQFMYGGKMDTVELRYTGNDIDAILDRLPTAQATENEDGSYTVIAEIFVSKGFNMWLRSQPELTWINDPSQ